jgi:hypothetical protein
MEASRRLAAPGKAVFSGPRHDQINALMICDHYLGLSYRDHEPAARRPGRGHHSLEGAALRLARTGASLAPADCRLD